jgi:hypothetical protein
MKGVRTACRLMVRDAMRLTAYRSPAHRCGDDLTRFETAAGMVDALIVMEARNIVSLIIMLQLHMLFDAAIHLGAL